MKIAYVYYLVTEGQLGVEEKIRQQQRALGAAGIEELEIIVLNPKRTEVMPGVRFQRFRHSYPILKPYDYLFRRYALIERTVDLSAYDAVLLRYPLADRTGADFCQRFPAITEHHTLEVLELEARLARSTLVERLARRLLLQMERRHGGTMLDKCQGIIGVTNHVVEYEQNRAGAKVPARTVGNGIDVEGTNWTGFSPFDGRELRLVFVASNLRPWHGLDRLINSMNNYRGDIDVTLHVVGNASPESLPGLSLQQVHFHGPQFGKDLDRIIGASHLAVDSLAMHRLNVPEGSTLKARSYLARGIPFIMAHEDPDIKQVDNGYRFYLRLSSDDSLLDFEQIIDFARTSGALPKQLSHYMREYAFAHMDWQVKLQTYVDFVKSVI